MITDDSTDILDLITIPVRKLSDGNDGENSISVILEPPIITLPFDYEGKLTFTGATVDAKLFNGEEQLQDTTITVSNLPDGFNYSTSGDTITFTTLPYATKFRWEAMSDGSFCYTDHRYPMSRIGAGTDVET